MNMRPETLCSFGFVWTCGNGGYTETIHSKSPSFTPNSTVYEAYVIELSNAIVDFSNEWRINRMRIDAVAQTATSVISIDKVSFISSIIPVNSIAVYGPEKLTKGKGLLLA